MNKFDPMRKIRVQDVVGMEVCVEIARTDRVWPERWYGTVERLGHAPEGRFGIRLQVGGAHKARQRRKAKKAEENEP